MQVGAGCTAQPCGMSCNSLALVCIWGRSNASYVRYLLFCEPAGGCGLEAGGAAAIASPECTADAGLFLQRGHNAHPHCHPIPGEVVAVVGQHIQFMLPSSTLLRCLRQKQLLGNIGRGPIDLHLECDQSVLHHDQSSVSCVHNRACAGQRIPAIRAAMAAQPGTRQAHAHVPPSWPLELSVNCSCHAVLPRPPLRVA